MSHFMYPEAFVKAVKAEYKEGYPHIHAALDRNARELLGGYLLHGAQAAALKLEDLADIVAGNSKGIAEFFNRLRTWGYRRKLHRDWAKLCAL